MSTLAYDRTGSGSTLVLIHGFGSRRQVWDPIVPLLAEHRDVITLDLPGFGESPLAAGADLSAPGLADTVAKFCAELGVERPHVAGNSLGGWLSFEMARAGHAASATGICPAGLWQGKAPASVTAQIATSRQAALRLGPSLDRLARFRAVRAAGFNMYAHPLRVPVEAFVADARGLATAPGYEPVRAALKPTCFHGGQDIEVPVTVAFGRRDLVITRRCRGRDELPVHTRWLMLPGCGHVPMYDDPALVARVLLEGSTTA